jgi:uncharacterized damage-inducible protein DinB
MDLELVGSAKAYAVGARCLDQLVGDFTDSDWQVTDSVGHSPRWIVGHLAVYRRRVLAMAGLAPEKEPWEASFLQGTSPAGVPADLDPRMLVQAFHAAQNELAGRWDALTPEDLAKPLGRTLPDGSTTVGGAICFMVWHEAYHLGQLGFMRRLAGKPGRA